MEYVDWSDHLFHEYLMKIILGSASPRRAELLEQMGFTYEIRVANTDELYPETLAAEDVAGYISKQKADALLPSLQTDELLICADTVVIIDDIILGKPANKLEAKHMLQRLSGKKHIVMTGVTVASKIKSTTFSDTTFVEFAPLSESEIDFYIEQYQPFDKAGSYGIQEWIGMIGITSIQGSYTNVMGLPTRALYQVLKNWQ